MLKKIKMLLKEKGFKYRIKNDFLTFWKNGDYAEIYGKIFDNVISISVCSKNIIYLLEVNFDGITKVEIVSDSGMEKFFNNYALYLKNRRYVYKVLKNVVECFSDISRKREKKGIWEKIKSLWW